MADTHSDTPGKPGGQLPEAEGGRRDARPGGEGPLVETTAPVLSRIRPLRMFLPGAAPDDGRTSEDPDGPIEDPRRIVRQGLLVVALFFGVLGLWATFGEISGAVVGVGTIKVESERKTVQHLEGGIVDAILVKEGEEVREGQILLELTSVQVDASETMLRKQLVALLASRERALAEKDFHGDLIWPDDLKTLAGDTGSEDVLQNEYKIFLARKDNLNGQISLLESQLAQLAAQISGFEDQLKAEQTIVRTLEEELGAKRQLYRERYLEKSQILELERTLASHRGERGRLRQAIAEARQDLRNRFVEEAISNAGRLENEIVQTRERIRPLRDAQRRLQVTAPVSGKVVDLKVHSRGGVVRAGEPLMDIVPHDTPLIIEMQVPINKITEVHVGQEANVQLDAFDTRVIPHMPGKVVYISADRLEDRTSAGAMPYYLCHVVVDPEPLKDYGLYLSPGMPATVFITTKKRTVMYYMFEPLLKNWDRALRE